MENLLTTQLFSFLQKVKFKSSDFNFLNWAARSPLTILYNTCWAFIERLTIADHFNGLHMHPELSRHGGVAISISDAGSQSRGKPRCFSRPLLLCFFPQSAFLVLLLSRPFAFSSCCFLVPLFSRPKLLGTNPHYQQNNR